MWEANLLGDGGVSRP